ncbi:MAG TPA: Ig-like domain-containing protein [Solirubrobacteraceae bacterium]|nr:Ig-like domain-containing protein [Solirubrobacteraceae bacterium]
MRLLRLIVVPSAVLALMLALAGAPAQAVETGVVINGPEGLSMQSVHQVAGLGVGWVRVFAAWNVFEPNRGHLNEPEIVDLEEGLAALPKGTKVIVDVVNTPQWETGSSNPEMPPSDPADYARFAGALAKRFAGRVAAWEIWNEEDASLWWASGPDPAAYTALLKAAYPAIKSAEPKATVVLGGLTGNDYEFLSQLYADGAKGFFNAVAVHTDTICDVESPYEILRNGQTDPRINRWSFLGYRTVHEVMLAHGDDSPIWMTELGWSTDTEVCNSGAWAGQKPAGVSPQQQATFLLQAYHCLAQDPYVQVGIWYGLQDTEPFGSPRGSYGLLDPSLQPKPAYAALAEYDHYGDRLTEQCGAQQGPTVKLMSPKTGVRYTNTLPISVTASDSAKVYQISLYHEGHIIRSFYVHGGMTTLSGHMIWYGARLLKPGKHTLTAKAFDERNNTSTTTITIIRAVKPKKHKRFRHSH